MGKEIGVRQLNDPDFDAVMDKLVEVAASVAEKSSDQVSSESIQPPSPHFQAAVAAALEPLEARLHLISRSFNSLAEAISRIESALAGLAPISSDLAALRKLTEQRESEVDSSNRLVDVLHQEMRGYKDAFLLEQILKPVLKDLISLYDDLDGIHCRVRRFVEKNCVAEGDNPNMAALRQESLNIAHAVDYLVEILARSGVERLPQSAGMADKSQVKIARFTASENPEKDGVIEFTLRRGFTWRGKPFRPEEVSVWRTSQRNLSEET